MAGENFNELIGFLTVARERSFTRAAAKLGVTQSTLSHTVSNLEKRLGLRLLQRTTRSVSPTDVGERLLVTIGPRFEEIEAELARLSELKAKPAGTVRITATDFVAENILWPRLVPMLHEYPDINVEIGIDYALTDIVAQRAAIDGFGIAFIPEELASVHLANGLLEPVLENWWPTSAGFHLYYSGRRESSPAFAVVVEALRYRAYA